MKIYNEKEYFESLGEEWEYKSHNIEVVYEFFYNRLNFRKIISGDDTLKLLRSIMGVIYKRQTGEYKLEILSVDDTLRIGGLKQEYSKGITDIILNVLYDVEVIEFENKIPYLTYYGKYVMESMNDLTDFEIHYLCEIEYLFMKKERERFINERKREQKVLRERIRLEEESIKTDENKDIFKTIKKILKKR